MDTVFHSEIQGFRLLEALQSATFFILFQVCLQYQYPGGERDRSMEKRVREVFMILVYKGDDHFVLILLTRSESHGCS